MDSRQAMMSPEDRTSSRREEFLILNTERTLSRDSPIHLPLRWCDRFTSGRVESFS
jgi:hypothetical protein